MTASRRITKKLQSEFIKKLRTSSVEVEVIAPAYRQVIDAFFREGEWDFDGKTDGFYSAQANLFFSLRLLLEAKFDLELRNVHDRAVIIAQCIFYMKGFEKSGHALPNVIMGGDRDQMFVVYAPPLKKYLDGDYDWDVAPSQAAKLHPGLIAELENDAHLATYVYDINEAHFDLNDVMMAVDKLAENNGEFDKIKITPQNIRATFDSFLTILKLNKHDKQDFENAVTLFITSVIGGKNAPRISSDRKDVIYLSNGCEMRVDSTAYQAFFSRYDTAYNEVETSEINAMYDVLIEEISRRYSGDYWTPTSWADEAHSLLNNTFGHQWRRDWVVWDPACGTKNLTRDYLDFGELYTSTLHQFELDTSEIYNAESLAFQYDFLTDDIDISPEASLIDDWKMPIELFKALHADKPILFLMNPPYATATNQDETHKKDVAKNPVNSLMQKHKGYKAATQQLYTQFLYRIMKLKEDFNLSRVAIGMFSNDRFMTGAKSWGPFLDDFQNHFVYRDGLYFNASEFSDVSQGWGISFTIWDTRTDESSRDEFKLKVMESTPHGPQSIGYRTIQGAAPENLLSVWLKELEPKRYVHAPEPYVRLSNALKVNSSTNPRGRLSVGSFGYFQNNSDSVEHSGKYCAFYSSAFGSANGIPVRPENFERCAVTFAVRKTSIPPQELLWLTGHDNYLGPRSYDESSDEWHSFVADSVVLSLLSRSGSRQSSLRNIEYQGREFNVQNEFFFLQRDQVKELALTNAVRPVLMDLKTYGQSERFAYTWLSKHARNLSAEGLALLNAGQQLVIDTFPLRNDESLAEKFHLQAWDAGFWQVYLAADHENLDSIRPYIDAYRALSRSIQSRAIGYGFIPDTSVMDTP